jgi:DNA-binding LacI/PurR family transcriptional regulator
MKNSIKDVADRCGLSIVTVSRVINNVPTVRKSNREKVLKAMKELNYSPSVAARSLALGKTRVIGLTISNLNDSFLDGVVKSVSKCLEENGYLLAVSIVPEERNNSVDTTHSDLFQEGRVDGVILLTPVNQEDELSKLQKKGIPFILLDNQKQQGNIPSVIVNNRRGGYEASRHLISLGHQKIAHISGPDLYLSSRDRRQGFLDALEEAGLQPFAIEKSEFSIRGGFEVTRKWIREGIYPSAIFAADDFIALGVINSLQDAGFKVPDDVSVIGYDDQEFATDLSPQLSTVKQPENQMGRISVELLLSIINGSNDESLIIKLDPRLVIRQTTACYKKDSLISVSPNLHGIREYTDNI